METDTAAKRWGCDPFFIARLCLESKSHAPLSTPCTKEYDDQSPFVAGFWPTKSWWEIFEDPCLDRLILTAIQNNPDLLVAKSRVEEAFQIARRAGGPRWVQASVEGDVNWTHLAKNGLYRNLNPNIPANATQIDLNGVLTYQVDIWGRFYETWMSAYNRFQSS
ncbi:MAG: hypothetical protein FJZ60_03355, partial [Chlamydiae bacterium]|nr:hypothetical protein [Chlamydiota bacterium]